MLKWLTRQRERRCISISRRATGIGVRSGRFRERKTNDRLEQPEEIWLGARPSRTLRCCGRWPPASRICSVEVPSKCKEVSFDCPSYRLCKNSGSPDCVAQKQSDDVAESDRQEDQAHIRNSMMHDKLCHNCESKVQAQCDTICHIGLSNMGCLARNLDRNNQASDSGRKHDDIRCALRSFS